MPTGPALHAVAIPSDAMVAMAVSSDDHVTRAVRSYVTPSAVPCAGYCSACPAETVVSAGDTTSWVTDAGSTSTLQGADITPSTVAVICAVPVLTVAVVYCTSPWQSHKLAITKINADQMRTLRLVLGFGFFALGWLKVYNHNLVAGVADNAPSVLDDPMVAMLTGSPPPTYLFRREAWVVAFGLAEVMSGFMVMIGVFSRVWTSIMAFMFTKLMLVDFGWDEIPHIYPIAAMLVVIFSNRLTSEVDPIEKMDLAAWRAGRPLKRFAKPSKPSACAAVQRTKIWAKSRFRSALPACNRATRPLASSNAPMLASTPPSATAAIRRPLTRRRCFTSRSTAAPAAYPAAKKFV